jgi:hypothetical protein
MRTITLPWETWRPVIDVLREKALPSMLEHADYLEPVSKPSRVCLNRDERRSRARQEITE